MSVYRFDLAGLTPEETAELRTRLGAVAFIINNDPMNRYLDLYTEKEIEPAVILSGFRTVKYVDYSNVPTEQWKYPIP